MGEAKFAAIHVALRHLIGASLSEHHTSELNGGIFIHIYILGECRTLLGERERGSQWVGKLTLH